LALGMVAPLLGRFVEAPNPQQPTPSKYQLQQQQLQQPVLFREESVIQLCFVRP
jgi:hypothetical protein